MSKTQSLNIDVELVEMSRVPYASTVVTIIHVMISTRPDVAFPLSMVSQYQGNPSRAHWIVVKNILKYLRITKDWVLVLGGSDILRVTGYSDANF